MSNPHKNPADDEEPLVVGAPIQVFQLEATDEPNIPHYIGVSQQPLGLKQTLMKSTMTVGKWVREVKARDQNIRLRIVKVFPEDQETAAAAFAYELKAQALRDGHPLLNRV